MRRDDIVFLKSEETYSEYYSLIGFLKLKGNYTFLLSLDRMQGYVEIKLFGIVIHLSLSVKRKNCPNE